MDNLRKVNKYLTIAVIISGAFLLMVSGSYAYNHLYLRGTDTGISGKSASFFETEDIQIYVDNDLKLETQGYINAENILPIKGIDIENYSNKSYFRVTNDNPEYAVLYNISLTDMTITDNLKASDFKWILYNQTLDQEIVRGSFKTASDSDLELKENIQINPVSAHEYILKIYLEETGENQIDKLNGRLSAKIKLNQL